MKPTKGYYSVIQYCPDASRLEAANIGVLLLCPDIGFVLPQMAAGNDRVRRFFKGEGIDLDRVNAAKKAIERRVEVDRERFRTPEDLVRFIDTRGNDIILTQPRPIKVHDPKRDLDDLFQELVGGRARRRGQQQPEIPELDEIFRRPSVQARIIFGHRVRLPVLGRSLRVPYAFHNGVLNLVKPQRFADDRNTATSTAMCLAIEGDLLHRHASNHQRHKLIVVPIFEQGTAVEELRQRIHDVLSMYNVRVVQDDQLPEFAAEVERTAHP